MELNSSKIPVILWYLSWKHDFLFDKDLVSNWAHPKKDLLHCYIVYRLIQFYFFCFRWEVKRLFVIKLMRLVDSQCLTDAFKVCTSKLVPFHDLVTARTEDEAVSWDRRDQEWRARQSLSPTNTTTPPSKPTTREWNASGHKVPLTCQNTGSSHLWFISLFWVLSWLSPPGCLWFQPCWLAGWQSSLLPGANFKPRSCFSPLEFSHKYCAHKHAHISTNCYKQPTTHKSLTPIPQ